MGLRRITLLEKLIIIRQHVRVFLHHQGDKLAEASRQRRRVRKLQFFVVFIQLVPDVINSLVRGRCREVISVRIEHQLPALLVEQADE